jgi:L-methionine (R)-S-oxide reductase
MAEQILDLTTEPKHRAYGLLHSMFASVLAGVDDDVTAMATLSSMIHYGFGHLWTGFYRVVAPAVLRVGPYQGTLGCLEIAFGRGVCGTAAAERRTMVVPDVGRFPGHIVCDARAKSEIVVPVFNAADELIAVLDVDSDRRSAFDRDDAEGLENVLRWFARPRLG